MNYHMLTTLIGSLLIVVPCVVAEEAPPTHQGHGTGPASRLESGPGEAPCQSSDRTEYTSGLEGLQVETADIQSHELLFETILHAQPVMRIDHPQVDHIRGYCYRNVLIVVRQDLKTPRPTGWVQINFAVSDAAAVKEEIDGALQTSPVAQRDEAERSKIVRIRLKPDVPRNNCRASRLEVSGPEGFMVGFDQFKEGTCGPREKGQRSEGRN